MKKYEAALLYNGYDYDTAYITTYEYETMQDLQQDLKSIVKKADESLYEIKLSILKQDEDGATEDAYTFCEIDPNELRQGEAIVS